MGLHPIGERAAAAERLVELAVRLAVPLGVALGDVDVEVVAHLLDEPDVLAGELAARARQRLEVRGEVVGALGVEAVGVGHLGQQALGVAGQRRRGRARVRTPLRGAARVPGERVDVALLDPVESQTEQQILADQGGCVHAFRHTRVHAHHRKCKTDAWRGRASRVHTSSSTGVNGVRCACRRR